MPKEIRPSVWKRAEDYLVEVKEQNTERYELLTESKAVLIEIRDLLGEIKEVLQGA